MTTLEVTTRDGWGKTFTLTKNLVYIGSDPSCDIVLESGRGAAIAPRHLQVIALPGSQTYRLVNIGHSDVGLDESDERVLPPHASAEIAPGEHVRIGETTLIFHSGGATLPAATGPVPDGSLPDAAPPVESPLEEVLSDAIGVALTLPETPLTPAHPLQGTITVRNLGDQTGVQFKLALEGLPDDCYDIGPGPILFPGGEREVSLQIEHPRGPQPSAGDCVIRVRATAPDYPGEQATASQAIHIAPFHSHTLSLTTPEVPA